MAQAEFAACGMLPGFLSDRKLPRLLGDPELFGFVITRGGPGKPCGGARHARHLDPRLELHPWVADWQLTDALNGMDAGENWQSILSGHEGRG